MKPDDDPDRCPLCHEHASFTVRSRGWVRLCCSPCRFSWTERLDWAAQDSLPRKQTQRLL